MYRINRSNNTVNKYEKRSLYYPTTNITLYNNGKSWQFDHNNNTVLARVKAHAAHPTIIEWRNAKWEERLFNATDQYGKFTIPDGTNIEYLYTELNKNRNIFNLYLLHTLFCTPFFYFLLFFVNFLKMNGFLQYTF